MADAAAKYAHNNAHTRRTPSLLMEYSELSHSLSGSHLNDRQAPSSRAASAKLSTAPNNEMASDVVLLELKNMSVDDQDGGKKAIINPVPKPDFCKHAARRGARRNQAIFKHEPYYKQAGHLSCWSSCSLEEFVC